MLSPLWVRILDVEIPADCSKQSVARIIAKQINRAIRKRILLPGTTLPTNRAISEHLGTLCSRATIELAWHILKNEYRVIGTRKGHGSHVVGKKTTAAEQTPEIPKIMYRPREKRFDKNSVPPTDRLVKGLEIQLSKRFKDYALPDETKFETMLPHLENALVMLVNNALCTTYQGNELYYSQSYTQLIHHICIAMLNPRKVFVVADTTPSAIIDVVKASGFKVMVITSDPDGIDMERLEALLTEKMVGTVYLRSRSSVPYRQTMTMERIDRLMEFQGKFRFTLIEDDRDAAFHANEHHPLMKHAQACSRNTVYIRPLSHAHPVLMELNIVVARTGLMNKLKNLFKTVGPLVNLRDLYSVHQLLQSRLLMLYELKVQKQLRSNRKLAMGVLTSSQLWKQRRLQQEAGFFFYLELKNGCLPEGIEEMLRAKHIFVVKHSGNALVISIAAYLDGIHLMEDLLHLNEFIHEVMDLKVEG
ncbi:hypothetical protein ACSBL2_17145 [Pedobacter sp. AW31-3R]|uniref:hypothetical protein n=1 Tax=Pedobacter sp. AW31-3R TaxID=3445781 RepID=UPI003FA04CBB